jgi:clan AA aspartic protease
MINGKVDLDEARISIIVIGNKEIEIEAVVDTGYTSRMSLPPGIIGDLGLKWDSIERSTLADGSVCIYDVFLGEVIWFDERRLIKIDEADVSPLIGMTLLQGCELKMEVCQGGDVTIRKL